MANLLVAESLELFKPELKEVPIAEGLPVIRFTHTARG